MRSAVASRIVDVVEQRERGQGDHQEHERREREVGDFAAAAGGRVHQAEDFGGDEPEQHRGRAEHDRIGPQRMSVESCRGASAC